MADKIKMEVPFFQAPNAVFGSGLSKTEMLVYLYLARCGNQGSKIFPSYGNIAEMCNITRKTVIEAVKSLMDKKIIKKTVRNSSKKKGNTSNVYTVEYAFPKLEEKPEKQPEDLLIEVFEAIAGEIAEDEKETIRQEARKGQAKVKAREKWGL